MATYVLSLVHTGVWHGGFACLQHMGIFVTRGTTLPNIATKAPYADLMVKKHYLNCIDYKCPLSPGPIASCFCPLLTKEVPYTRAHHSSAVTNGIWVASTAFLILLIALSLTTAQEKKCESLVDGRNLFAREQSEP